MADAPAQPPAPQPIANVNVAAVSANLRNMADLFPVVMMDLEQRVDAMQADPQILQEIQQLRDDLRQTSLYSIRALNYQAARNAPVSYPVGTDHAALSLLAPTKAHAINISGANALAALNLLGVPNPPQGAAERREQFLVYIGILH